MHQSTKQYKSAETVIRN